MLLPDSGASFAVFAAIIIVFSAASYGKKLLDLKGIILADIIGSASFLLGGMPAFLALIMFYAVAETITVIARKNSVKHEQRSIPNIMGNSGPAIIALLLGQFGAFFAALSAAFADTASSEIGMLARERPVLITSLEKVEKGTDGGITVLWISAAVAAATIMGLFYYFAVTPSAGLAALIVAAGIAGSVVDSFLGAVFERRGKLDNTQVNFIASASGAAVFLLLQALI